MFSSVINQERSARLISTSDRIDLESVLKIDSRCLTNFLSLVRRHFDVFQDGVGGEGGFGAKDLLKVIRTGGQTNSRVAFQKELLVNLENQLQTYCNDVVNDLRQTSTDLFSVKVKRA